MRDLGCCGGLARVLSSPFLSVLTVGRVWAIKEEEEFVLDCSQPYHFAI